MLPAMVLGLLPLEAGAQEESLPSVSDYHLPTPSPRATRASGPVDPHNPVTPVKRDESPAAPTATPSASASAAPAKPAPKPTPSASASASPTRAAAPRRAEEASPRKPPEEAERTETRESKPRESAAAEAESASPAASPSTAAEPPMPPVQWNVHSAKEADGSPIWPWLLGIAVLLASNALLLVLLLRRRQRNAEERLLAQQPAHVEEQPLPAPVQPVQPEPVSGAPVPPVMAEPEMPAAQPEPAMAPVPARPTEPQKRPALELVAKPIEVTLAARQLSATLMNAVLNYELVVTNLSDDAVGPVIIAGDMIGAHASLPARSQLEITGNDIEPHHRHPVLHPREWAKFSGEFRLPLAAITPIRSGRASLFIPLARFRVEVLRKDAPPLVINRTFVIGETPETPEAALKPFRLDLGPRLYSHIGQREVAATA